MDKTSLAEWMLAQRFGVQRAREIAGDLLEQHTPARAHWEMFRLALSMRGIDLVGLLLVSLLVSMTSTALYSPWQLRFMAVQRDLHLGWSWDVSASLYGLSSLAWLGTAISAFRLGPRHSVTRSGLAYSVTLPILSGLLLQQQLRWITPMILTIVVYGILRSSGVAATLSFFVVNGAVDATYWLLAHSYKLGELRSCMVHMHTRGVQPPWFTFYLSCAPLAIHTWFMLFVSALVGYWMLSVLPVRNQSRPKQDDSPVMLGRQ